MTTLNGKSLTLADILISAQEAATRVFKSAIAATPGAPRVTPDVLVLRSGKMQEWGESGLPRADFGNWEHAFDAQIDTLWNFANQPALSTATPPTPTLSA